MTVEVVGVNLGTGETIEPGLGAALSSDAVLGREDGDN